ncbi:MAG: glycosyltransferase family 2 protein, partial [Deltaproteobacteria bacterium]|nr:glycosyltransferase family 2 protein [Deltaproteobacteria bacterium]
MAREIATAVDWPCEVKTLFRKRNLGCRMAVSSAVTWFFRQEPEGIVLEDDVLPHPDFFPFCDTLLAHYRDTPRVMQISGNNFQLGKRWGDASYYFSIFNHIWGWASWARAWNLCDLDMPGFRSFMRHTFPRRFPLPEASAYFMTQFERIARGTLDTWDYSWQYCHFLHDGLTVIPNVPLAKNIGFGSGAHCLDPSVWAGLEPASMPLPLVQPDRIGADMDADKTAFRTVWKAGGTSLESLLALGMERARTG